MTRLTPIIGSKKTMNISYATPREDQLGTPETLPTSEPTDPQVTYTVLESDLPTFNIKPYSTIYLARLIAGGQFVTAGTCYWRMTKNGVSVANSSFSVSANNYYAIQACFLDVKVDDVLGLKIWSNQTDSNWDRSAFEIHPSRIYPLKTPYYKDVTVAANAVQSFTKFNATTFGTASYLYIYNGDVNLYYRNYNPPFTLSPTFLACVSPYGIVRVGMGDSGASNSVQTSTGTSLPVSIHKNPVPTQLVFRGVYFDRHQ